MKITEYTAVYKCRLCGEEYNTCITGNEEKAITTTISVALGINSDETFAPTMHHTHFCTDGGIGISDFQGWKLIYRD